MAKSSKFPPYKIVPVNTLVPYARNARTHSDEQVALIAASIREFGFLNPIIVDADGGIIAGHGRVLAAGRLGLEDLPCVEVSTLSDAQKRAYILADNKLALNASWDEAMLRIEIDSLRADGFDLALTGFGEAELGSFSDAFAEASDESAKIRESFQILIDCRDEGHQAQLLQWLNDEGVECRALVS